MVLPERCIMTDTNRKVSKKQKLLSVYMSLATVFLFAFCAVTVISNEGGFMETGSAGSTPAENISEALESIWVVIPIFIVLIVIGVLRDYMRKK